MFVARKETRRDLVLNVMKYVTTLSVGGLDVTRENHGGVKLLEVSLSGEWRYSKYH